MLLAIDTSTHIPSIALYDERGIVGETTWQTHENHTRSLMPQIVNLMKLVGAETKDLRAVASATGPGSFTGLRIGLSVAKGLAFSLNIPLLGVPTLDISAHALTHAPRGEEPETVCAILRAGRARYGGAVYLDHAGTMQHKGDYFFGTAGELAEEAHRRTGARRALFVTGELDETVQDEFRRVLQDAVRFAGAAQRVRRAGFLAALAWQRWRDGRADDLQTLAPYYIPTLSAV